MKLKIKGKDYAFNGGMIEIIIDTNQYLSIEHHEEEEMVEVSYGEKGRAVFEKDGFTCEVA